METSALTTTPITSTTAAAATAAQPDRITMVAREFESLFTSMMLKAMRKTVGESSLIPESMGEKIYTGMLDDEYAKLMSMQGTLGLSDLIEKELRRDESNAESPADLQMPVWMLDERLIPSGTAPRRQPSSDYEQLSQRVEQWSDLITQAAQDNSIDRSLVAAMIAQESGGNQYAVSRAGAKGLMQLMDSTAGTLGVTSSFDPQQNIQGGARYLRNLLDKFDGNERLALASYNAGPAAVEKYKGIPPYRETQDYVRSVLAMRDRFSQIAVNKE
jgi:Rod binding domain-containing protein